MAARRYPMGLESMHEELEAEAERRKAERATCEGGSCGRGGYILSGDPREFDRQRQIIDAARNGDFAPSIEDAQEKYRQDTSADAPNYAPREYWPSTVRSVRPSIRQGSASDLMQPTYWSRSLTAIFVSSQLSNSLPPWLAHPHRLSPA